VIDPPEPLALSQLIHRFSQRYAVYRNASRGGTGKVFEERFTSVPIRSDRQLAATLAYVELNPVRAGLGREPADYRWTTYRLHTGIRGFRNGEPFDGLWTPSSWYLRLGPTPPDRARAYADFVRERRESTDDLAPSSLDRIAVGIGYDRRPNRARTW
jgi:putative transposase